MWNQYCSGPAGHLFMSAGESAEAVLEKYDLLLNANGQSGDINWEKLKEFAKEANRVPDFDF